MIRHISGQARFLLRELATDSGSEQVFFEQIGQELVRLNIDSSYLYLLSPPQRVKQEEGIRLFDSLRLYLRQSGQNYDSYTKKKHRLSIMVRSGIMNFIMKSRFV